MIDLATRAASNVKAKTIHLISWDHGAAVPVPPGVLPGVAGMPVLVGVADLPSNDNNNRFEDW